MEQYQLLPLIVAAIALLGGMFSGLRLQQLSWAPKAKPYAFAVLLLAILFGTVVANWLTALLMVVIGSHWISAMISISLLSFLSGVIFALCGNAKKSHRADSDK